MPEKLDWDASILDTIAQMTGQEPLLKSGWVTISYQETAISPYKLVAVMENEQDAEMFLGLMIPLNQRWRYRLTTDRTLILL